MTFFALLTKEMRLRLRRERTIWIMIIYLLLMGILGWLFISSTSTIPGNANGPGLSDVGVNLYAILSQVQLFLIIFITPSFTATAINGEKERQTYDMLVCSHLSPLAIVLGKLSAGLLNALLLIAASVPLFSLVFFFGGIGPVQVGSALITYIATALWIAAISLFCSALFTRTAISTAVAYICSLLWVLLPFLLALVMLSSANGYQFFQAYPNRARLLFAWNPTVALVNTYPPSSQSSNPFFYIINLGFSGMGGYFPFNLAHIHIPYWLAYTLICLAISGCFILFTTRILQPYPLLRLPRKQAGTPMDKAEATA